MTKLLVVPLAVALCASTAFAESRAAHLLGDAPKLLLGVSPRLLDAAQGAMDGGDCAGECECKRIGFGELFAKTSAVGMASSTAGVLIGAGLGSLSSNLIFAALPVLLANLFLPPVLTVLAAMLMGNWDAPGRFGFWLPVLGAFAVNAVAYVLASLVLVVPWTNPVALLLYTLVDGLLMSGATVGVMALTEKKPTSVVKSFVPGITDTTFVPLVKVDL